MVVSYWIPIGGPVSVGGTIREALERSGLSLRELARRAGTSHATISTYLSGRKVPRSDTLERIVRAAGFALDRELVPRADAYHEREDKGRELRDVLDLADALPSRHEPTMPYPRFPGE